MFCDKSDVFEVVYVVSCLRYQVAVCLRYKIPAAPLPIHQQIVRLRHEDNLNIVATANIVKKLKICNRVF